MSTGRIARLHKVSTDRRFRLLAACGFDSEQVGAVERLIDAGAQRTGRLPANLELELELARRRFERLADEEPPA